MAKKKLLLIDFDQEFLKFLSRALTDEGFETVTATDGLSGFERFSEIHPDLVIMEAMLPKFHGFELCSRITSHPTKKAPVIIVTGIYKDSVYKTEALRSLRASAFFEKPLNLEELLNKIYELIGKPETKKIPASAEKELDQLLKEALSLDTEEKKPAEKVKPVEKPRPVEKQSPQPRPAKEPQLSKDDEVDLILRSKLKDLMVENSKPEPKPKPKPEVKPAPRPAVKPEPEKPAVRPDETKKAGTATTDSLLDELIKKPAAPPAAPRTPKAEPVRTKPRPEPVIPSRPEPRPEPKKELKKETQPAAPQAPVDNRPRTAAPVVNPFKGFIEEKEEEKKHRSGAGKYIGLAAVILAVAGVVAFLTLKKKEAPAFSGPASQQVAALQTGNNQPGVPKQSEEEITQEIARQIEAYKSQKEQASAKQPAKKSAPTRTADRQPAREEAAPFIPKQTTSLASLTTTPRAEPSQAQTTPPAEAAGTETNSQTETASEKASEPVQTAPEPQVVIPAQDIKPGDLVPLNVVDVEPKVVKTVEPIYPEADRRMGNKGQVLLNVLISENGDVLEAAVIRGIKGSVALEKEAINAVKKWKFLPAEKNGVKVRVWKPVTIGFGLDK
ncbi:MAG: TonB family protein [Candidatus Aminicenantes bacterium]|nr:TonB family protein [Candidatus Aminicenantes bacterium]